MGIGAGLDGHKKFLPQRYSIPGPSSPVEIRYTDYPSPLAPDGCTKVYSITATKSKISRINLLLIAVLCRSYGTGGLSFSPADCLRSATHVSMYCVFENVNV